MKKKILVIAAHPDDEILGCGGTVARLSQEGHMVYALILEEGITSRDEKRNLKDRKYEIEELKKQACKAGEIIGVRKTFIYGFPDNRFDSVELLDIVKVIEKSKNDIKPTVVFTHYEKDLNIDHGITFRAVITATRPSPQESVKEIYSFEVLSSTEWGYPLSFSPDVFFDISSTINLKLKTIKQYKSELRDFPCPRSLKGIELNAESWGMKVGLKYAEAFKCVRCIK